MSLFPHTFVSDVSPAGFHPLFRLLDDFDQYSRGAQQSTGPSGSPSSASLQRHHHRGGIGHLQQVKLFTPKFDVQETAEAYELHGDLPGMEQKDVEIEFTDHQTLSIRGRHERSYESRSDHGTTPATAGAITEQGEKTSSPQSASPRLQPTVEDENVENQQQITKTSFHPPATDKQQQHDRPQTKYWVTERSVGEFSRAFTFPTRVDQDGVTASMRNGVLHIVVPKLKKPEARRIVIS